MIDERTMPPDYEAIVIEYTDPLVVAGDRYTCGMRTRGSGGDLPQIPGMKGKIVLVLKNFGRALSIARILNDDYFSK